MLHTVPLAGDLERIGREARTAVGEHVGNPERKGAERVREEGYRRGRGLVVLDGEVHVAGGAVDGDVQVALASGAVAVVQLGQMLHVDVHEADFVVLEGAVRLAGPLGRRQPVQALRLEDAIDGVPVQVRQEVADDEGQRVEGEAGAATERAHDGALLIAGAPGQLMGPGRAILTGIGAAFAPFADGLGGHAVALGQHPDLSAERAISARTAGVVRAWGWMASINEPSERQHGGAHLKPQRMGFDRPTCHVQRRSATKQLVSVLPVESQRDFVRRLRYSIIQPQREIN